MSNPTQKVVRVRKPFRSLANYKSMHAERARERGVLEAFLACKTLTAARRLAFG